MNISTVLGKLSKLKHIWNTQGGVGVARFLYHKLNARRSHQIYQRWIIEHAITPEAIQAAQEEISQWTGRPKFSILMPVYNVDIQWLEKAIASVQNQIYPDWELCIADDASPNPLIRDTLNRYAQQDSRIKVVFRTENGNISAASNSALEMATGAYVALLDHDDELAINALYENAKLIHQHPDADFIYSDEDKIDTVGRHFEPFFKPTWSPEYFQGCMYTCHLGVYRTSLMREIGGFRSDYDGAQDWDLALRLTERTRQIYHIPKILYHWRVVPTSAASGETAKPWAYQAARRTLEDMVARSPYPGRVDEMPQAGFFRVRRDIMDDPLISIIIPSAGKTQNTAKGTMCFVENCVRSIRRLSTYPNYEIVVVDGQDIPDPILDAIAAPNLRLVRCQEPFNFSHRMNQGVAAAKGEVLLMLNDDIEVITPDWLESMLELAQQREIGAVGAKLFFPNGRLQHAGVLILGGNPCHAFYNASGDYPGYYCSNLVTRNYLGVTAACLMVRREVFEQVGGFDESFPLNYNDVDLCLKIHQAGYRNVFTPHAQLIHYESVTRKSGLKPGELERLRDRWALYLDRFGSDPYYNPNLCLHTSDFSLC